LTLARRNATLCMAEGRLMKLAVPLAAAIALAAPAYAQAVCDPYEALVAPPQNSSSPSRTRAGPCLNRRKASIQL
jgi:hypothetical protein